MGAGSHVVAVHRSASHSFSKFAEDAIRLVPGLGVEGDAHAGATVRHRARVARDPAQPNLRQVHLLHAELFDELMAATLGRDAQGGLVRKAGVMAIVVAGGEVKAQDGIRVELPAPPHAPLGPV